MKFELTKQVDWGKIRINLDEFNEIFINIQDITVHHWDTTWKQNKPLGKVYLFDDYKLIFSSLSREFNKISFCFIQGYF